MKNLPVKIPDSALIDLRNVFIPANTPDDSFLELSIRIGDLHPISPRPCRAYTNHCSGFTNLGGFSKFIAVNVIHWLFKVGCCKSANR